MTVEELIISGVLPKKDYTINIIEYYRSNMETDVNGTDNIPQEMYSCDVVKIRSSSYRDSINIWIE